MASDSAADGNGRRNSASQMQIEQPPGQHESRAAREVVFGRKQQAERGEMDGGHERNLHDIAAIHNRGREAIFQGKDGGRHDSTRPRPATRRRGAWSSFCNKICHDKDDAGRASRLGSAAPI